MQQGLNDLKPCSGKSHFLRDPPRRTVFSSGAKKKKKHEETLANGAELRHDPLCGAETPSVLPPISELKVIKPHAHSL